MIACDKSIIDLMGYLIDPVYNYDCNHYQKIRKGEQAPRAPLVRKSLDMGLERVHRNRS